MDCCVAPILCAKEVDIALLSANQAVASICKRCLSVTAQPAEKRTGDVNGPRRTYCEPAEWIVDSGETNLLIGEIDGCRAEEHVHDGQIVLNISPQAVRNLNLGDDFVMCTRFSSQWS